MHFSLPAIVLFCSYVPITLSMVVPGESQLSHKARNVGLLDRGLEAQYGIEKCTPELTQIRKEWRTLSEPERRNYIDAVLCLQKKPSILNSDKKITGLRSRFDDFQFQHIKQSFSIHFTAQFFAWHRLFVWAYEKALKEECGYSGTQPYWDWFQDADLTASPLFDGSQYSLGGNGELVPAPASRINPIRLAPGFNTSFNLTGFEHTGGGCVTTGPFANFTVAFGPVGPGITDSMRDNPDNFNYTPHCLKRDFRPALAAQSFTQASLDAIMQSPDIAVFNVRFTSLVNPTIPTIYNLHGKGHHVVGGDLNNFFSSPGDPSFYLHHTQVDRLWAIWQAQDPSTRQYAISGHSTLENNPPSPVFQLSDTIDLGGLFPPGPRPIRDFLNTREGPFCYEYV